MQGAASWVMLATVLFFLAFLLLKLRVSLSGGGADRAEARRRYAEARKRIRGAGPDRKERAKALREAAMIALSDLRRPNRAASLARRADLLDPEHGDSVQAVVRSMRAAGRYPALEKLLWRRLADAEPGTERYALLLRALIELYDGPMRRPHQADALRSMAARLAHAS